MSEIRKPFETFAHYKIGKGHVTLSVSVDEGNARVGVAYCHPRDGLNKGFGRTVARGRRDTDCPFSFDFKRNKQRLGSQLRDEFEGFVVESGRALGIVRELGSNVQVGAPPWAIHSLNRELRKRERLMNMIDSKLTERGAPADVIVRLKDAVVKTAHIKHTNHPVTCDCS